MHPRVSRTLAPGVVAATCLLTSVFCADRNARRAVDFFPLEVGARWTYQVFQKKAAGGRLRVKVTDRTDSPDGPTYSLTFADSSSPREEQEDEPIEYSVRREGVYCEKCPGFILKDPLVVGEEWQSGGEPTRPELSRVVAVATTVMVGTTRYQNCIVVRASDREARQQVMTTYAPRVGPVAAEYRSDGGVLERREELLTFQRAP